MSRVLFLRSQEPSTDSRLQRYLVALNKNNIKFHIIGWLRKGQPVAERDHETLYDKFAPIGGGSANIAVLVKWNIFLFKKLWEFRKNYETIHSVDFDTCIVAYIFSRLFQKKLVVDIYDKYTDSRSIGGFLAKFISALERFVCERADVLILPDECRIKQLSLNKTKHVLIVENVPLRSEWSSIRVTEQSSEIKLAYVGILEEKHRGLENLVQVVSELPNIKLIVAGAGPLDSLIQSFSEKYSNITFLGSVDALEALNILSECDLIVGMYYKTIKNHLYAAPNKYYEHLMLGKALLTTEGIPIGFKVTDAKTGFSIGEDKQELSKLLHSLNKAELEILGRNAKKLWVDRYSGYLEKIEARYIDSINKELS